MDKQTGNSAVTTIIIKNAKILSYSPNSNRESVLKPVFTIDVRKRLLIVLAIFGAFILPIMWEVVSYNNPLNIRYRIADILFAIPLYLIAYLILKTKRFEFYEDHVRVSGIGGKFEIPYAELRLKHPFQRLQVSSAGLYKGPPQFRIGTADGNSEWDVYNAKIKKMNIKAHDWTAGKVPLENQSEYRPARKEGGSLYLSLHNWSQVQIFFNLIGIIISLVGST